jgi:glycosyltransferase involved in cell wall biosynthesis
MLVRRARGIAVLSEFMHNEVRTLDADAATKVMSIPGGMDTTWFSPGPPVAHPFAQGDGPLLVTARRFVPRTGVEALVEAMPAVLEAVPGARLAICGDGPLRPRVEERIAAAGLGERVRLLGRVSDEELLGWYRAADLFVMPTQALEGFGLAAAEALACGTPAVGTNAGAVPEVLAPLDPRLVATGHDAPALAAAIVRVLSTPDLLGDVAARARAQVHPHMSWDAVAERYLDLYAAAG